MTVELNVRNSNSLEKAEKYFLALLDKRKSGERLPSIRQIKKELGVGQSVIEKTILKLQGEGLLRVRQPVGLFKAVPPAPNIKLLDFANKLDRQGFYFEFVSELLFRISEHNRRVELVSNREQVKDILYHDRSSTILAFSMPLQDFAHTGNADNIIHLLPNFRDPVSPALVIDDYKLVEMQLNYLSKLGHKRIAYVHNYSSEHFYRADNVRWDAFHHIVFEKGLEFCQDYLIYRKPGEDIAHLEQRVSEVLQLPNAPTAIVMCSDRLVRAVYGGIRRTGLEPGRDIAVIGTNNRMLADYVDPPLTSCGFDFTTGFNELYDMIIECEKGIRDRIIYLSLELFERESSGSVSAS